MSKEGGIQGTLPYSNEDIGMLYDKKWVLVRMTNTLPYTMPEGNIVAHGETMGENFEAVAGTLRKLDILPLCFYLAKTPKTPSPIETLG